MPVPLKKTLAKLAARSHSKVSSERTESPTSASPATSASDTPTTPTPPLMPKHVAQWPPQDWLVRRPVSTPGLSFSTERTSSTSEPSEPEAGAVEATPVLTEEPDEMSVHELSETLPSDATSSGGTLPSAADDVVLQDEPEEMDEAESAVLTAEPAELEDEPSPRSPKPGLPRLSLPAPSAVVATASSGASKTPEFCASPGGMEPSPITPVAPPARAAPQLPERRARDPDDVFKRPEAPRSQQSYMSSALAPDSYPFPRPPLHPSRTPTGSPRASGAPPITPPAVKETLDARSSLTPDGASRMFKV